MQRLNFDGTSGAISAAMQLAIDEAMLVWAESTSEDFDAELLRFWRFKQPTVVLGRSSKIDEEVHRNRCAAENVEVLRRCTGGASVVGGPGCLMYSVVLRVGDSRNLRKIDMAHDFVMSQVLQSVRVQCPDAERLGICDLTLGGRKFSGNSLRVMRRHLLYHGTVLIDSDLAKIARLLATAPRQPDYRLGRDHLGFITNVAIDAARFRDDLAAGFGAIGEDVLVRQAIESIALDLMGTRYSLASWHHRI